MMIGLGDLVSSKISKVEKFLEAIGRWKDCGWIQYPKRKYFAAILRWSAMSVSKTLKIGNLEKIFEFLEKCEHHWFIILHCFNFFYSTLFGPSCTDLSFFMHIPVSSINKSTFAVFSIVGFLSCMVCNYIQYYFELVILSGYYLLIK